jgi:quinol monooxygenase YgiN
MIKVVARMIVKEHHIEEFISCASELVSETRKEEGCIAYQLYQDVRNNKLLTFIEEYENQEAFDFHMKSGHFNKVFPKLVQFQEKEVDLNIYKLIL